jgi:hypothetical protein
LITNTQILSRTLHGAGQAQIAQINKDCENYKFLSLIENWVTAY